MTPYVPHPGMYQDVYRLDRSGKWRGRFFVEPDGEGGWQTVDDLEGMTMSFDTKREAEECAKFCRDYVREWGAINFLSFPYSIDDPPVEKIEGEMWWEE